MNRFHTLIFALSLSCLCAVSFVRSASADLVYEKDITVSKLEVAKIDATKPGGVDITKDDYGVKRDAPKTSYSARVLLKDNLMKMQYSTGNTYLLDLTAKTITKLDRKAGTYSTLSFDDYFKLRDMSEAEIQRKRAANARALIVDIKATLDKATDKKERKALEETQLPRLAVYEKIVNNDYTYAFIASKGRSEYFEPNVFNRYRAYLVNENETRYISYLGTDEVAETPNKFIPYLRVFMPQAASQIAKRSEFPGYMKFYYHFTNHSVAVQFHVRGFCRAKLPESLFKIPVGYKQIEEKFETIIEGF